MFFNLIEAISTADETHLQALLTELDVMGLATLSSTSSWLMWPCTAVTLQVTSVFSQTPGPEAGAVLK